MRNFLLSISFLLFVIALHAGKGTWVHNERLKDIAIGLDYSINEPSRVGQDYREYQNRRGIIKLNYARNEQSDLLNTDVEWRVSVGISYLENGIVQTRELKIDNASGGAQYMDYEQLQLSVFETGYSATVTSVLAEYKLPNGSWQTEINLQTSQYVPHDIDFKLELCNEVIYNLESDGLTAEHVKMYYNPISYRTSWSYLEGAEEYDFEWVFIDKYSAEYTELTSLFSNTVALQSGGYVRPFELKEPTRVRVWGTHYQIDKTYPEGILYFRVRAVSQFAEVGGIIDQIKTGEWTYFYSPDALTQGTFAASDIVMEEITANEGYELGKNWMYGVAYAEEGKSVSSSSFYDGSNRGRQSLSYNTSDNVTMIGETKFDYEGRQTVSVIPAPVHGRQLGYHTNFNLAGASDIFDEEDLDVQNYVGVATANPPLYSPPSGESGAAQYFSENNQFTDDLFRAAIPDAEGYVYSQTVYRNDGTGRIERVGGVGPDFKVNQLSGSLNHVVETFYGSPTLVELKRLFGENVSADMQGYRKEMVRDANGQYSVTYYDKRGHVIATGLSGESPTNLIALEDQNPVLITTPLNDNNVMVDPYTKVSEHTFMNAVENNSITLQYDLQGQINQITSQTITVGGHDFQVGTLCSTCRYDLTIEIKDQNGVHQGASPYTYSIDPSSTTDDCNQTASSFQTPVINITLVDIGEYRIIKTLTLDLEGMQTAFNNELSAQGLLDPEPFIEDYLNTVDLSGCFDNCEDYCVSIWKLNYIQTTPSATQEQATLAWNALSESAQQSAIATCMAETCDESEINEDLSSGMETPWGNASAESQNMCSAMREQMVHQISPGGVFFESFINDNSTVELEGHELSYYLTHQDEWPSDIPNDVLENHREYCHLQMCDDWSASQAYSMKLTLAVQESGWNASSPLFTEPYNTDVATGITEDPFKNSVFNNLPQTLQDRVDNYLDYLASINETPLCGTTAFPTTGSLVDYVNAYVNCIAANQTPSPSAQELQTMRLMAFKGMYDQIKEDMIAEYKAENECVYFDDDDAVFIGDIDQNNMEGSIADVMNAIQNTQGTCEERSWNNTILWMDQLSHDCVTGLGLGGLQALTTGGTFGTPIEIIGWEFAYNFQDYDLQNAYTGNTVDNLAELFYAYGMKTCATNTWGWFYNPDADDSSPDAFVAGEAEYDAIMTLLSTTPCADENLSFIVDPAPSVLEISYVAGEYTPPSPLCIDEIVQSLNIALQNATIPPLNSTTTYSLSYTDLQSVLEECNFFNPMFSASNPPSVNLMISNYTGYTYEFTMAVGSHCFPISINTLGYISSQPLTGISDPVLLSQYASGGVYYFVYSVQGNFGSNGFHRIEITMRQNCGALESSQTTILDFSGAIVALPNYTQDCIESEIAQATIDAENLYNQMLAELQNQFLASLDCIETAEENFVMSYYLKEYQYTLYYYDLAGNLVQTVPPQGVDILTSGQALGGQNPNHKMETRYKYNGLNTLIAQYTPDGGHSDFHVDKLYRIRYSQNARQAEERKASYMYYDPLGRVVEAGEFLLPLTATNNQYGYLASIVEEAVLPPGARKLDHTITYYEDVYTADPALAASFEGGNQENLRNAIGAVYHIQADYNLNGTMITGTGIEAVTAYSYDPHKNVKQVISANYQLVALGEQYKKTEYEYDLISGNVEEVIYQKGKEDEYRHAYHYDANNRLIRSFTSDDGGVNWEMDAKYFYYLHGSLARVETGHDKVQGTDYAYNLQGWLKGVNSATLSTVRDLGKDGQSTGINKYVGADSYGYQLGYFDGDYQSIGNVESFAGTANLTDQNIHPISGQATMGSLYNGNISHMVTAMRKLDESILEVLGNNYQYDQLQRIKSVDAYSAAQLNTNNSFFGATLYNGGAYQERYSFDKNGNLKELTRNGSGKDANGGNIPLAMDHFKYQYYNDFSNTGSTLLNPEHVNRLASVNDQEPIDSYDTDINPGQVANNYQYDKSGQLIKDIQEGIEKIEWTVTGKVKRITFTAASNKKELKFVYDPMDMRVAKIEYLNNDHSSINYEYYSYDVRGNVMATYERVQNLNEDNLKLLEHHIYGAQRLGIQNSGKELKQRNVVSVPQGGSINVELSEDIVWGSVQSTSYDKTQRIVEDKRYELANHLGNVLVVVTDRKVPLTPTTYTADVVSFSDYSPYGVQLDQRHGAEATGKYKYGFQGQESDDEIKGEGNSVNYKYRMHDPRIGRFFAVDPLVKDYPYLTPYQFSSNRPIDYVEIEGCEGQWYTFKIKKDGTAVCTDFELKEYFLQTIMPSGLVVIIGDNDPIYVESFCASCDSGDEWLHEELDKIKQDPQKMYEIYAKRKEESRLSAIENEKKKEEETAFMWAIAGGKQYQLTKGNLNEVIVKPKYTIANSKFKYFRGKKIKSTGDKIKDSHNLRRAMQNKRDFKSLGLTTKSSVFNYMDEAFENGTISSMKTTKWGLNVEKRIDVGDKGSIYVTFQYANGDMSSTPRVTTIIPKPKKTN